MAADGDASLQKVTHCAHSTCVYYNLHTDMAC